MTITEKSELHNATSNGTFKNTTGGVSYAQSP